jgi:arabinogalactan oligomer/maltooligosaccharide transport system substrate-binding protein
MEDLNIQDVEVLDKIKAYNFHDTPPVMALDNNPNRLARSLYTEVDIMEPLRKLFNKEITRDEAVKQIVQLTNDWLKENDTMKEE